MNKASWEFLRRLCPEDPGPIDRAVAAATSMGGIGSIRVPQLSIVPAHQEFVVD
jgi:hypothetical protein